MRVEVSEAIPEADVLAFPVGPKGLPALAGDHDAERVAEEEEIGAAVGRTAVLYPNGNAPARRVVLVGLGPADELDADAIRTAAASVAEAAERVGGTLAWLLDDSFPTPSRRAPSSTGSCSAPTTPAAGRPGRSPTIRSSGSSSSAATTSSEAEAERAATVAEAANRARDLANTGANELTPERLADRAAELAEQHANLTAEALGPDEITKLGMGAFAGVAQGSHNPPRMIVMRYEPPSPKGDVVLGPRRQGDHVRHGRHLDQAGALHGGHEGRHVRRRRRHRGHGRHRRARSAAAHLAVVAATENAVGGGAYRPGDILTAMNGKTIEITNTDAEGRLVLADALHYARELGATHLVDFATLTGAMNRAFGDLYAGVMGNDDAWRDEIVAAGEASGDHAWPWPMHRRYRGLIDSAFADMKNSSVRGQAQPTYAASFLEEFVGEGPWAHVDVAGTAFFTWGRNDYLSQKGGTGYGVRLIAELATKLSA